MNHRHLLPDEVDLLLDEAVGFGVAPLKAHLRDCPDCQARVDEAKLIVAALEDLPHLAPSFSFTDKVMAQVPVFVPWHVAARDSVRQWLPRSRPAQVAFAVSASFVAMLVTSAMLWIATETDTLVFASGIASDRVQRLSAEASHSVATAIFGEQLYGLIRQTGSVGITVAVLGFAGALAVSVVGLRRLAAASSRRRA